MSDSLKIATLQYSTRNLGDDLQSLAMERLLPHVNLHVDRDDLSPAVQWDASVRWIVNGWFSRGMHKVWPPPGKAKVLYVGFHATGPEALPPPGAGMVGCRDPWTLAIAQRSGLDAWLSYCPTLTLARLDVPRDESVLLVDVPQADVQRLPQEIAQAGVPITHILPAGSSLAPSQRRAEVLQRLDLLARARWVVTTRLHVLLPCAAMGTPVVFIKPPHSENRYGGYLHLGWRIGNAPWETPRPKCDADFIDAMTAPLRLAVRRFIES